jgi:nucleotide-binding universal stress UspA family protein
MDSTPDIRTVLIAVDGSAHARKAALVGAMLAEKFAARVVLLHVLLRGVPIATLYELALSHGIPKDQLDRFKPVAPPVYDFGLTMPAGVIHPVPPTELLVELGRRILETERAAIEGQGVATVIPIIADDDAANKILEVAQQEKADFVVLGRRGLGALQGVMSGSVSTKVSHVAPATVISVT